MEPDDLAHFGVKGMKWGVRRDQETPSNTDFSVDKGTKVYNISGSEKRELKGHVFGAHTELDILNYRGNFGARKLGESDKAYSNQFEAKTAIKVASGKTQAEEFKKLWDSDRETLVEAIAVSQKQIKVGAAIMHHVFGKDRDDVYRKRISEKGERWVAKKGALELNQALGTLDGSPSASNIMRKHYTKMGYNALLDLNDTKYYESEKPVIYLTPKKSLKSVNAVELSIKEVRGALLAREFLYDRKKYGDVHKLHNTN